MGQAGKAGPLRPRGQSLPLGGGKGRTDRASSSTFSGNSVMPFVLRRKLRPQVTLLAPEQLSSA